MAVTDIDTPANVRGLSDLSSAAHKDDEALHLQTATCARHEDNGHHAEETQLPSRASIPFFEC
jgi:hypothetical protein